MLMIAYLKNTKLSEITTSILIIIFTYTAVNKLVDYATFSIALRQSPILQPYSNFLVFAIPLAELLTVALLIFSDTRRLGLYLSWALMICFTLYISYLMLFAEDLPCNCGGIFKMLSWKAHLVVNIILLGLICQTLFTTNKLKNTIAIDRDSRIPV